MYSTREEVESWLKEMSITDYVINEDFTVNVNGIVDISCKKLKKIPINFGLINGDFYCNNNNLTNLEGSPEAVIGDFNCSGNQLTSLKGCPEVIKGNFNCNYNELSNLECCPQKVNNHFNCYNNKLTSLEGCPEVINGSFDCSSNKLTSLKGCPKVVNGDFDSTGNSLTSLEGVLFAGGNLYCKNNKIKDLSHLNINNVKNIYLNNNEISECNWMDNTEEKGFFSKISLLFRDVKKIDLSNNNINEKSLLSVKSIGIKIVIKLKDNKDLYLSEEYNEKYLNLFKLKNNLSNYQDEKIRLIKDELNILKNEVRDEFKGEKIIKKRKL